VNFTVVPSRPLGYLSTWPAGQSQPFVSTLNALNGEITSNAAIVPAGDQGAINVFVTDPTDVIVDVNGYFAPPGSPGALNYYPVTPCRAVDTRLGSGPFGGPLMNAGQARTFYLADTSCGIPPSAEAFSLNATVVPVSTLGYLSLWPNVTQQPIVSTLNALDGSIQANAAVVAAGAGASVSAYATNMTALILDVNGFFAP
jgi:hypothetical protein